MKYTHVFLTLILTLAFSHCATVTSRPLELTLWLDTNDKEIRYFKQMAQKLREKHPNYRLKMRFIAFDNLKPRFQGQVGETREPDILFMANDWIGELAEQNLLRPLTLDTSEISPSALAPMRYRDRLYGAPFVFQTIGLVYNKAHVKTPPADAAALLALQARPHDKGAYTLLYDIGNFYYHAPWFHACGGRLFDRRGKLAIEAGPLYRSIQWAQTLQRRQVVPKGSSYSAMVNLFASEQADLMITGPWSLSVLDENELSYGVAPLPQSPCEGVSQPFLGVKGFGLNHLSENPQAAQEVIAFFISEATQQAALKGLDNLPVHKKVLAQPLPPDKQAFAQQLKTAMPLPNHPMMKHIWQELNFVLGQALHGPELQGEALNRQITKSLERLHHEARKYDAL